MCARCGDNIQPFANRVVDDSGFAFHDYCWASEQRDLKWEYNALEADRWADESLAFVE
jgi:hypothetical protein